MGWGRGGRETQGGDSVCVRVADSCCTVETYTTLENNYASVVFKVGKRKRKNATHASLCHQEMESQAHSHSPWTAFHLFGPIKRSARAIMLVPFGSFLLSSFGTHYRVGK